MKWFQVSRLILKKSSIQFGHKIEEPIRQELQDILGIQNIGGMGSYLGIPEKFGWLKNTSFWVYPRSF